MVADGNSKDQGTANQTRANTIRLRLRKIADNVENFAEEKSTSLEFFYRNEK